jgi:energy-coupling factor transporter ATP-binding protein EcfA2
VYNEHGNKDLSLFDSVEIKGLFGDQNEYISFEENEHIKILYGLNASGKSTVLSIIQAVLSSDYISLFRLPFNEVIFRSKRETLRDSYEVPMNLDISENKRAEIMNLIDKSSLDLTLIHRGEESDNVGVGYDVEHLEIPGDVFIDEHTLTIRKFRPESMKIVFRSGYEEPSDPGILLDINHELSRTIPVVHEEDSEFFQAIGELDFDALPSETDSNYKQQFFDSFGGVSKFGCVVRSLEIYDFSVEHWRQLKKELAHLFTIRIDDHHLPERYHWDQDLFLLRDINIETLDDEDNFLDTQNFIEHLLPKPIYLHVANSVALGEFRHPNINRFYFNEQQELLGQMDCWNLGKKLGTELNIGPIEYFLQSPKGHIYLWNGPVNQFSAFKTGKLVKPDINRPDSSTESDNYRLKLPPFPKPQIIHLSAARTVGDNLSEYSELYEFTKSMKNKISDALKFIKYQSRNVVSLKNLPYETVDFDEYEIDSEEALHCFLDCKSDAAFLKIEQEIDPAKRMRMERIRSKLIDKTDTYLELIATSLDMYREDIRGLIGHHDVNLKLLSGFNSCDHEHMIYAHDHNISIEMIWNAIEDLTSVFRLKKLLQNHFGKTIMIDRFGEFLFEDQSPNLLTINQLSSGEKQLILLYWKILEGMDRNVMQNIVLIDEPELSLHITWQRDFVENLEELLINQSMWGDEADGTFNVKIFIATHSPSILENHIDKTYELGLTDGV